jgi:ubiquitin carboxyl-terminal hydrolase 5/13
MNLNYDWTKLLEAGGEMVPLKGAGHVGLRNIGSSCYMNSVLQVLACVPEFKQRYVGEGDLIRSSCEGDATNDFAVQMSKVATALLTDRYVPPASDAEWVVVGQGTPGSNSSTTAAAAAAAAKASKSAEDAGKLSLPEKYIVAPRMFKHLVGRGHADFSSGRQQDAQEYFQFLLAAFSKAERTMLPRINQVGSTTTSGLFEFKVESRWQCTTTGQVRYKEALENTLNLVIPLHRATNKAEVESRQESKRQRVGEDGSAGSTEEDLRLHVPLAACLESAFGESTVDFVTHAAGRAVPTPQRVRIATYPRYLMVKMGRYAVNERWQQVKIDAIVDMPEELDLSPYKGTGPATDEELMPDDSAGAGAGAGAGAVEVADDAIVTQLMSMGFGENASRKAAIATNNVDAEQAMNWVMEHMGDSDFNDPPTAATVPSSAVGEASPEAVATLSSFGYTEAQARAALAATDGNLERAADWIFSHPDELDAAVAAMAAGGGGGSGSGSGGAAAPSATLDEGCEGKYSLVGVVSHIGRSTDHGHYVCHCKKDGQWALFNDEKVAASRTPPLDSGFMYLYRRQDGPGIL